MIKFQRSMNFENLISKCWRLHNYTIYVSKKLRNHLALPYGQCRYYDSTSSIECHRKCMQSKHREHFNCIPPVISYVSHELDYKLDNISDNMNVQLCKLDTFQERVGYFDNYNGSEHYFHTLCLQQCPKDCFTVEYEAVFEKSDVYYGNQEWFFL